MRLIDGDELYGRLAFDFEMLRNGALEKLSADDILETIHEQPTVDPVKHGQWIDKYGDGDWHCSCCGAIVENHEQDYRNWYFCYHCGARMDGDKNG